jgi:hypothetical protein
MNLTTAQIAVLKAAILADPILSTKVSGPGTDYGFIAAALNTNNVPDFWAWRTLITKNEIVATTSGDGTIFAWTGTGFITRAQGERDAWRELFNSTDTVNPSLANVRQAFADIFSGVTAPAPANRAHLLAISRRKATLAERRLATGTGSTAVPGFFTFEGGIAIEDIGGILA